MVYETDELIDRIRELESTKDNPLDKLRELVNKEEHIASELTSELIYIEQVQDHISTLIDAMPIYNEYENCKYTHLITTILQNINESLYIRRRTIGDE